jgi:hypothetical protein
MERALSVVAVVFGLIGFVVALPGLLILRVSELANEAQTKMRRRRLGMR